MGKRVAREMKIATQACVSTPTERRRVRARPQKSPAMLGRRQLWVALPGLERDRKSTRLNSSHGYISYAVFCLKKKTMLIEADCALEYLPQLLDIESLEGCDA